MFTREEDIDAEALHRRGWSISAIALLGPIWILRVGDQTAEVLN